MKKCEFRAFDACAYGIMSFHALVAYQLPMGCTVGDIFNPASRHQAKQQDRYTMTLPWCLDDKKLQGSCDKRERSFQNHRLDSYTTHSIDIESEASTIISRTHPCQVRLIKSQVPARNLCYTGHTSKRLCFGGPRSIYRNLLFLHTYWVVNRMLMVGVLFPADYPHIGIFGIQQNLRMLIAL